MTENRILCMNVNGRKAMVSRTCLPICGEFHKSLWSVSTKITRDYLPATCRLVPKDSTAVSLIAERSSRGQPFAMSRPDIQRGGPERTFFHPSVIVGSGYRIG